MPNKALSLIEVVQSFPRPLQALLLGIDWLQRMQTYTLLPGMPILDGKEFSKDFSDYIKKHPKLAKIKSIQDIKMPDGKPLHALYLPPRGNNPLVFAFHGIKGNWFDNPRATDPLERDPEYNPQYRMELLKEFANDGYGFMAFSLPGFEPSKGEPSEENFQIACKAFAEYAVKEAKMRRLKPEDIIVCGESLGGAAAAIFAKEMTKLGYPPAVLSLIATFDSLIGIVKSKFPLFSEDELRSILKQQLDTTAIFKDLNPKQTYLHIVEADNDKIIPKECSENLLKAARAARVDGIGFNVLHHPVTSKHTTWNATYIFGGKKTAYHAREVGVEIAEHHAVKDIEKLIELKK